MTAATWFALWRDQCVDVQSAVCSWAWEMWFGLQELLSSLARRGYLALPLGRVQVIKSPCTSAALRPLARQGVVIWPWPTRAGCRL